MTKIVDAYGREIAVLKETFTFVVRKDDKVVAEITVSTTRGWALARRDLKELYGLTDEEIETIHY